VLNAAFSLRGLTSGALLGGLILAITWKRGKASAVVTGMLASLLVMTAIQLLPTLEFSKNFWQKIIQTEVFWPWYTLIGAVVTTSVARVINKASSRGDVEDR
jgi:Na+/proline symporter